MMKKTMMIGAVLMVLGAGSVSAVGFAEVNGEQTENGAAVGTPCQAFSERENAGGWSEEEWEARMSQRDRGGQILFDSLTEEDQDLWLEVKAGIQDGALTKEEGHAMLQEAGIDAPVKQQQMRQDGSGGGMQQKGQQNGSGNGNGQQQNRS
ncbi:hypothetical protein [Salisediminibacterium selenitireducens]|uniref:Uncharacterized protein n=1 Tax=Bacillus selenitireducens (strain ATCC 700615 / DSM 15326 / MLS10) TaxID=439292 RepID=D6XWH1_BACIE|nr:hypothetical protein [Salisediminibacterium selenitireducens]ADH97813.1 hypothetical protein Bsel_0271 [[Bacillus] selenitireducens MLS10]